jgi:hypothetical protein
MASFKFFRTYPNMYERSNTNILSRPTFGPFSESNRLISQHYYWFKNILLYYCCGAVMGQSVLGLAICWTVRCSIPSRSKGLSVLHNRLEKPWPPVCPLSQWIPGFYSGKKRPWPYTVLSPPSSTEVKNEWIANSTYPPPPSRAVWHGREEPQDFLIWKCSINIT